MGELDTVIVPLNCPSCAGPIDVACEHLPDSQPQTIRFVCPYCQTPREFDAPGPVKWVAMRQHSVGPETRH